MAFVSLFSCNDWCVQYLQGPGLVLQFSAPSHAQDRGHSGSLGPRRQGGHLHPHPSQILRERTMQPAPLGQKLGPVAIDNLKSQAHGASPEMWVSLRILQIKPPTHGFGGLCGNVGGPGCPPQAQREHCWVWPHACLHQAHALCPGTVFPLLWVAVRGAGQARGVLKPVHRCGCLCRTVGH